MKVIQGAGGHLIHSYLCGWLLIDLCDQRVKENLDVTPQAHTAAAPVLALNPSLSSSVRSELFFPHHVDLLAAKIHS